MGGTPCIEEIEGNVSAINAHAQQASALAAHANFISNATPAAVAKYTSDVQTALATLDTSLADLCASVSVSYPVS